MGSAEYRDEDYTGEESEEHHDEGGDSEEQYEESTGEEFGKDTEVRTEAWTQFVSEKRVVVGVLEMSGAGDYIEAGVLVELVWWEEGAHPVWWEEEDRMKEELSCCFPEYPK